jgi:restriction endonuclease S subunit
MPTLVMQLGGLANVVLFRGVPTSRTESEGEIPVYSVAARRNGDYPQRYVSREELDTTESVLSMSNDIWVTVEGGTVGECLVIPDKDPEFVHSQQVAMIRVWRNADIDPWYLGAWLSSFEGRDQVTRLARGSTIKRIAFKDLAKVEVPLPALEQQRRIGARYRAFSAAILAHQEAVSELLQLRDADLLLTFTLGNPGDAPYGEPDTKQPTSSTVRVAQSKGTVEPVEHGTRQ